MLKKILFVSDFPPSATEDLFAELKENGIRGIEIFPEIKSEITTESPCVVALLNKPSEEMLMFLRKNVGNKSMYVIFASTAVQTIYKDSFFRQLSSFSRYDKDIIEHARWKIRWLTRYLKKENE